MTLATDAHKEQEIDVQALKCGCCGQKMQKLPGEKIIKQNQLFKRPCNCVREHKCFMCGWCLEHCRCGAKFWVD